MFIESLKQLGFSEKEARVYLTLLKVGPSPASTLASRVGMKRVTVYNVLDSLKERGIVSFKNSGKCRRYVPHDPECLLRPLEHQSLDLKCKLKLAQECISKLQDANGGGIIFGSETSFFKGSEAITKALHKRLNPKAALFVIFAGFGKNKQSSDCLIDFLKTFKLKSHQIFIAVPEGECDKAKKEIGNVNCSSIAAPHLIDSNFLLQEDQMFFMFQNGESFELLYLNNPKYVSFLKEIFLKPYFW